MFISRIIYCAREKLFIAAWAAPSSHTSIDRIFFQQSFCDWLSIRRNFFFQFDAFILIFCMVEIISDCCSSTENWYRALAVNLHRNRLILLRIFQCRGFLQTKSMWLNLNVFDFQTNLDFNILCIVKVCNNHQLKL